MSLTLGAMTPAISGNITQLKAVILADFRWTETNNGYHAGRLSQGYKLLLLMRLPQPKDFELHGNTLRSGGKFGLPGSSTAADALRGSVHDSIREKRGADGYRNLQQTSLESITVKGPTAW